MVGFRDAEFTGSRINFASEAKFSGSTVDFADAGFEGDGDGDVSFCMNLFSRGEVSFVGAEFTGGTVSFRNSMFQGGTLCLNAPGVWSRPPEFDFDWEHAPPGVKLPSDALLRELESLDTDTARSIGETIATQEISPSPIPPTDTDS